MVNKAGRPLRGSEKTEKLEVWVQPTTRSNMQGLAAGRSIGEFLDGQYGVPDANGEEAEPGRGGYPSGGRAAGSLIPPPRGPAPGINPVKHKPQIINGGLKVCQDCGLTDKKWALSCPGKKEAS